jgi:hypothetical protein
LSLPLVFLGIARDFWRPFDDYAQVEDPRGSTFFLVPVKGQSGIAPDGSADATRAAPYQISEIDNHIRDAAARGSELAVHGIDAWRSAEAGNREMQQLTALTGREAVGVRMHWLYFDQAAPRQLEAAGFEYDSTCGYNDAVGYRAGTSQVFRLPDTQRLFELPMAIMDSALLSSDRMGLAPDLAMQLCREVVATARRFGGTVVVNWHCRSLAPERLWGEFYQQLLKEIGAGDKVWFARGSEAVEWFRWRRSIRFCATEGDGETLEASAPKIHGPAAVALVHELCARRVNVREHPIDGTKPLFVRLPDPSRQHV